MTPGGGGGREVLGGLHLAWVRQEDLPPWDGWLSSREQAVLAGLRLPKRRIDWLLGRWAAKRAVGSLLAGTGAGHVSQDPDAGAASTVEILAAEDGRPVVRLGPPPTPVHVSISHAGGVGFAAASSGRAAVGCDVEVVEARSAAFVTDYLTERESAAVRGAAGEGAALMANLIWSAKESALKVLGEGLRMDTRQVEVEVPCGIQLQDAKPRPLDANVAAEWRPLQVSGPGGAGFRGSWRTRDGLVWTVLTGT